VQAYRAFVQANWGNPPATAVMVAFHNLVTASVTKPAEYCRGGVQHYVCMQQATQAMTPDFVTDVQAPAARVEPGLPGLATNHRLVMCR